jgi:integrase
MLSVCFQFCILVPDNGGMAMRAKITKTAVDKMKPMTVLWDTDVKGFGVRRHNTDGRHYLLRYRFNGRQTFRKIGRHGSPFTPEMARAEALRLLGLIVSGTNPAIADRQGDTFATEVSRFLEHKKGGLKPGAFAQMQRHLLRQAQPLHPLELASIDRRTIAQLLSGVERGSGPTARNRLRSSLSSFFGWLVREGLLDINPVAGTGKADERARDRVLTEVELTAIWRALGDDDADDIIRLLALTGQRRDEISRLRWSEVDWDRGMLVLPPERTKNRLRHELPLPVMALTVLRKRWDSVRGSANDAPVFRSFAWTHAKARLDARLKGVGDWRLHDLRRTCATMLADKLGVLPHHIEAILNHVSGHKAGVAGVYQRARYEGPMRDALARWAAHVEQITRASN